MSNYLPEGTVSIFYPPLSHWVDVASVHRDTLGRWTASTLVVKEVKLLFITVYRIPNSTDSGPYTSLSQYNVITSKFQSSTHYRAHLFEEISYYILTREDISEIVLAGDINKLLHDKEVRKFYVRNGLFDIFLAKYEITLNEKINTYRLGRSCIDYVAATFNILPFIKYTKLTYFS